jgi:hypothetical protein
MPSPPARPELSIETPEFNVERRGRSLNQLAPLSNVFVNNYEIAQNIRRHRERSEVSSLAHRRFEDLFNASTFPEGIPDDNPPNFWQPFHAN